MARKPKPKIPPPGTYIGTIAKIRKVRNKNAYRMTLQTSDGVILLNLPNPKR